MQNRKEWADRGQEIVAEMKEKLNEVNDAGLDEQQLPDEMVLELGLDNSEDNSMGGLNLDESCHHKQCWK